MPALEPVSSTQLSYATLIDYVAAGK
jgi:hypothetical protein